MRLAKTSELIDSATPEVFSNSAFGVFHKQQTIFYSKNCGKKTLFDLASLTKVLCTTTLCVILEKKGVFKRTLKLKDFFPAFKSSSVRTEHLLTHVSGFPAWLNLHEKFRDSTSGEARDLYEKEILKNWNETSFEKKIEYSDLGFMLLGWVLEKITGESLDILFQEYVTRSTAEIRFDSLQFLPANPDIAPTEDCPWRKHVLRGEVHDDNCYVLGGVAGHAGLFGDIEDVVELAKVWLQALTNEKQELLDPSFAQEYWKPIELGGLRRAAGWDCPSRTQSSAGDLFSSETRGHLGYTGTSLWIDPKNGVIVSLLTNRLFPTRKNEKIRAFRPIFHNTVLGELGFTK